MSHPTRSTRRRAGLALAALLSALVVVTAQSPAQASGTLKAHADARGFDIGFALDHNRLGESAYKSIADSEFNLVVAENAMKWDATEPNRGQFSWSGADAVSNYATTTNKKLYGHTLVWHSQLPGWASNISSGSELLTVMRNHINAVAGRYAGKVTAWDVVNEAFEDNGSRRQSVFQQRIGDSYIAEAFRAARAADPAAKLCINDYSTDAINSKSTAIYNLVSSFKQQGVPIDCVGFQAHLIIGQVPSTFQQNLQRFADLGVDVRITELDIRMQMPADAGKLAQQANDYRAVVQACMAVTRCRGVTTWGITDRYSWVPGTFPGQGAALIWDDNYAKKPAYATVHDALAGPGGNDTTRPSTPGQPVASNITSNSVSLSWPASTDNVGVTGYTVYREAGTTDVSVATPTGTSATISGLTASTAYQFYVVARDAAGNVSFASPVINVTTSPGGGDSTPPTAPGQPVASNITSSGVSLSWPASTDNVGVTGYTVYREAGATDVSVATPSGTSATISGLTASTAYQFYVVARDAAGNVSAPSPVVNVTTSPGGGGSSCRVSYVANSWNTGFTANLVITNTGSQAINGWSLVFGFSAGQTVVQPGWNAAYVQSGSQVTATNLSYNGSIPANGSTNIGFNGTHTGNNPSPASFSLNGTACTIA